VDCERLVVENLPLVDSVVRQIARRHRLSTDEAEELAAAVRLKLVERDYEVLRKFEGRSQLRTYLITVVQRHFLDDRNARWGKWRPSAQSRRLGPVATLLDQLLTRDHLPFDEAVLAVRARHGGDLSREELHGIMLQLPIRTTRRFLSEDELEHVPASAASEDDIIDSLEQARSGDRIERALANALARLDGQDRVILKMRFCDNLKLARIAELLGLPAKPFYRRVEDLMRILRTELEAQGVSHADVAALVEHPAGGVGEVLDRATVGKTLDGPSVP
jgi:RNA polymerase sigma factor for flagellar operon FliA